MPTCGVPTDILKKEIVLFILNIYFSRVVKCVVLKNRNIIDTI